MFRTLFQRPLARSLRSTALALAAGVLGIVNAPVARAYNFTGAAWADGNITMHLQLGSTGTPLLDGEANWGIVAEAALNDWNAQMTRSKFAVVHNSTAAIARGNRINNVIFRSDIYGTAFGDRVLAVTLGFTSSATGRWVEQDVLFNSNLTWNSYRGALRPNIREFRRVALHEFGHVIGLDHPDEATPVQNVAAIMNSTISNTETLQADDITGAKLLYDTGTGTSPTITAHPQSKTVRVGDSYTLGVTVNGAGPFTYSWGFRPAGATEFENFDVATGATYTIGSVQPADAGTYTVIVSSPSGAAVATSNQATLTVTPLATDSNTLLANISTRGVVGTGDSRMIAGFVITGSQSKSVLVRAVGPALTDFGVAGALANPTLSIVNNDNNQSVAQNDDWESGGNGPTITAAAGRLGAFQFKTGSRDSAVLVTLPPGSYSAVISGVNNTTGIALAEVYEADTTASTARKFVNIATRGQVNTGENVLIAGLVVRGPGPRTYLIRAVGPTMLRSFRLPSAMQDPFLQLYQGETLLRENDDWDHPSSGMAPLRAAAQSVGAFALVESRTIGGVTTGLDAAMLVTLQPGTYTAKVTGFEGSTGVGLIEIYEMP